MSEECRALLDSIVPVTPALNGVTAALHDLTQAVDRCGAAGTGAGPAGGEEEAQQQAVQETVRTPAVAPARGDGGFGRAAEAVHKCAEHIHGYFEAAKNKTLTEEAGTVWSNATYAVEAVQGRTMGALAITEESMRRRATSKAQSGDDAHDDDDGGERAKK
jgi:hypothetical protein